MALPKLSDAERKAALRKALEVRRQRAVLKANIKKGQTNLSSVLGRSSDPIVGKMKVSALLESLPGVGKARARRLMGKLSIDSSRRVQGLGSRQRELLLKELS